MSLAKENLTESLAEARQQLKERVPLLALPDGAFDVSTWDLNQRRAAQ
jgi:hypothetical protein